MQNIMSTHCDPKLPNKKKHKTYTPTLGFSELEIFAERPLSLQHLIKALFLQLDPSHFLLFFPLKQRLGSRKTSRKMEKPWTNVSSTLVSILFQAPKNFSIF